MNFRTNFYRFCAFLIPFIISAQHNIDSLQNLSFDRLQTLYKTNRYSNLEKTKQVAKAYYQKASTAQNDLEITRAAFLYAVVYDALSQQDSALYFIDIYIKRAADSDDLNRYTNGIYKKGTIAYNSRDYREAIINYTKAFELTKSTTDEYKLSIISNGIGLVKNQFGQRKQALHYFKQSFAFFGSDSLKKTTHIQHYLNTLNNLSNTYTYLAEDHPLLKKMYLDSAAFYGEKGLKESTQVNDLEIQSSFITIKGIISQKRGKLQEAASYLSKAETQIQALSFENQLPTLQLYIGKNYYLMQQYDTAISYLLKVDRLAEKENITAPSFQETYILLAQCYEMKNDQKNALFYYKRFQEKDAANDQMTQKVSEKLYNAYDIPSLQHKIDQLQEKAIQQHQQSRILLYVSAGLLFLLVLGFIRYRNRLRKYRKKFDTVLKTLQETENSTSKENAVQSLKINDENIVKILHGLKKFEEKNMFLQKNCSINFVAKKIHTNKTYLSKILQSHKQKKFVQYITDLRIEYALSQLKNDTTFRKYDIKSIASELGFNTAESFSKAFKKRTGIYPSFYIKNLNKLEN